MSLELFDAIEEADFGRVWKLVKAKEGLQEVDAESGLTPMSLAAELGHTEVVRILVEAEVNPDWGGSVSPLEAAALEGNPEIVDILLDAGAEPDRPAEEGFTPLMSAATVGNLRIVRRLLDAGADPRRENSHGDNAIDLAEDAGFDKIAGMLRRHEPPPPAARDLAPEGMADEPFWPAPMEPEPSSASRESVAPPQNGSEDGETGRPKTERELAREAAKNQDDDWLSKSGPLVIPGEEALRPESPLASGGTPSPESEPAPAEATQPAETASAETEPAATEPAETALSETASSETVSAETATTDDAESTESGGDPTELAGIERFHALLAVDDHDAALEMVEEGRLDVEERDRSGRTPLMVAAELGSLACVGALLDAGADPNSVQDGEDGETALVKALGHGGDDRPAIIERLAERNADLDLGVGARGTTPLMVAAREDVYGEFGNPLEFAPLTKLLVSLGADLEAQDQRGDTVYQSIKRSAMAALTSSPYRRRLHQMQKVLESLGARQTAAPGA